MIIKRSIQNTIQQSLHNFPIVGIIGSRQVGKTTLAKEIAHSLSTSVIYLDLELPSDVNKLKDAELYLSQYADSLVIIDEIQRMPELFPLLRALVDQKRVAGRFLILGSASPNIIKHASETLAGRVVYHELTPLLLTEINASQHSEQELWLRGGYPPSLLTENDDISFQWRNAFIQTHLERDIPQFGIHIPAIQLRRFLTMVAHTHGQLWNASVIAKSMGVAAAPLRSYVDTFTDTFIIRQLQPYFHNTKKRLVKSPKLYIRDSGILHTLMDIHTNDQLQSHPIIGNSWEGYCIENIIAHLPVASQWSPYFYRTHAGAEIDLVLIHPSQAPIAIEIKYTLSPNLTKGFWNAYEDLGCTHGYIIYPGKEMYQLQKNVSVLPLKKLVNKLATTIGD